MQQSDHMHSGQLHATVTMWCSIYCKIQSANSIQRLKRVQKVHCLRVKSAPEPACSGSDTAVSVAGPQWREQVVSRVVGASMMVLALFRHLVLRISLADGKTHLMIFFIVPHSDTAG